MEIVRMCRRQYVRALSRTHERGDYFPKTLVDFFSWFPGLKRFIGTRIVRFSTAVDESDMQLSMCRAQAIVQAIGTQEAAPKKKRLRR